MVGGGPHNSMTMPISDKSVQKMPKIVTPLMVSIILGRPAGHSKLGRTAGGGPQDHRPPPSRDWIYLQLI